MNTAVIRVLYGPHFRRDLHDYKGAQVGHNRGRTQHKCMLDCPAHWTVLAAVK